MIRTIVWLSVSGLRKALVELDHIGRMSHKIFAYSVIHLQIILLLLLFIFWLGEEILDL